MKALYIALLIFILPTNMLAQWEWQNPTPFGNGLSDIQFINNLTGYACGRGGTLIKTINGGNTWAQLTTGTDDSIIDVFFLTEETGWFITYDERLIYNTTDGGITWNFLGNFGQRDAHSLWFFDEMNGFASGYQYLLSTTDGGVTWNENNSVQSTNAIFFANTNVGFVGGYNLIYKTTNGGIDWGPISIPASDFTPSKIFALDHNKIFLVGSGNFQGNFYYSFIKSTNGGNNWNGVSFDYWLTDVYFKSVSEGWVCSDKIYKTTDGGNNWEPTDYSGSNFEFKNSQSWAISGWNTIIYSDDYWITANQQIRSVFSGFIWNGAAKDTNIIFACGSNKTIVGSVDGGTTWNNYFESSDHVYLNAITFNDEDIWVVGNNGVVLHSTDYGNSWDEELINASGLRDVDFVTDSIGYIVGTIWGLACIFVTQDGGQSWHLQETFPEYSSIDGIEFSRENLGWMIAHRDGLLKSTDLGKTWNVVLNSVSWFEDIAVCGDTAWFSYSNKVLRTTDAGISWETITVFGYQGLTFWGFGIDFVSSVIGYAGTYDSRIFKTTDGGLIWSEEDIPTAMPIQAIDFVDPQRGWAFGDAGTILKRDPNYVFVHNEKPHLPIEMSLSQNYPNPFNPTTTIRFTISDVRFTTLKIYDVLGREVATLVNEEKPTGNYEVEFNGTGLPSGIYFYNLKAGDYMETRKMVLLR